MKGVFLLAERVRVVIDAGHGGTQDPGAVYYGRREKDDVLRLALAVGQILIKGVEPLPLLPGRCDDCLEFCAFCGGAP